MGTAATTVVGIDYNSGSVDEARRRAQRAGASDRVRFSRATATEPPSVDDGYDLITFVDDLHDLGDPVGALAAARRRHAPWRRRNRLPEPAANLPADESAACARACATAC